MKENFEIINELPGSGYRQFYFPVNSGDHGSAGLIVRIYPASGESWIGIFRSGYSSKQAVTGVYSWPDRDIVCVVSKGQGYIVKIDDPLDYKEIKNIFPILHCIEIPERGLIIVGNFTKMAAFSSKGLQWESQVLSYDGLSVLEVTKNEIKGEAWDASINGWVPFSVEISTGKHKGGAYFKK